MDEDKNKCHDNYPQWKDFAVMLTTEMPCDFSVEKNQQTQDLEIKVKLGNGTNRKILVLRATGSWSYQ